MDDTLDQELQDLNSPANSDPECGDDAEAGDLEANSDGVPEGGDVEMQDVSGAIGDDALDGVNQLFQ